LSQLTAGCVSATADRDGLAWQRQTRKRGGHVIATTDGDSLAYRPDEGGVPDDERISV
jgi:hypothetical protein